MNATAIDTMDIIERLRTSPEANILTNEAADEISRLRGTILRLHQQREILIAQTTEDKAAVKLASEIIAKMKSAGDHY